MEAVPRPLRTSVIAESTGGTLVGPDVEVRGATQDSRRVRAGQLFVPVVAARDGHDFIRHARAAGAGAYLSAAGHHGGTAVLVDDTAAALERLGASARAALPDRVVGVTGSVGKTSTKDLAAAVLATTFATHASDKSFNNELGVPLTLLNAREGTEAVVVEMGARGRGHVAALCRVASPTVGIVTRVGAAHLEMFGTLDDVAVAKRELVESLPRDGVAVLNANDARVLAMRAHTTASVLTFGSSGDVRASDVVVADDLTSRFLLETPWGAVRVTLAVRGRHNVDNALAAAAAGLAVGVELDALADALASASVSSWRMELLHSPSGARILNDSYNANPVSMAAALDALAHLRARRRVAVLGPMAELGDDADDEHRRIGQRARAAGIRLIAIGAPAYEGDDVDDLDQAVAAVGSLGPDDAVLVKGSRVAGLERLAARLASGA
jgi:UDP-N-acetylmuramoyl-tripeptide--D-alanyl-D-alanine ligase